MTANDITLYSAPLPDRVRYATVLADAQLLPDQYRGKPANLLLALEYGAALNIAPMVAVQEIHVIKGKPTLSALLQSALVRRAGHTLRVTGDHQSATCQIIRADDPDFVFESTWTLERAKSAGLLTNDSWRKYPDNMLKARAISECARNACPDVIAGFGYTAEELGDDTAEGSSFETDAGSAPVVSAPSNDGSTPSADPASDIHDAVVVDETPGAGVPEGKQDPAPGHPETDGWFTRMQIALKERFGSDRVAAREWIGVQVGHDVASTKELSPAEVRHVVDVLAGRKREAVAS